MKRLLQNALEKTLALEFTRKMPNKITKPLPFAENSTAYASIQKRTQT